jgi:Protein of unknown function (DUF4242)
MLPSPSLGPPLLSASLSPAPGPWGIPLELELDALDPDDFDVVAAGDELFVGVGGFVGVAVLVTAAGELLFACEEELPELPQPAAITPAAASASKGNLRASLNLLNMVNLCLCRESGMAEPSATTKDDPRTARNLPWLGVRHASPRPCAVGFVPVTVVTLQPVRTLSDRRNSQGGPGMKMYAIRRRNGWQSAADLEQAAARSTKVGNEEMADDIRWIRSYVLAEEDGSLGTVCIYEASSPEAIRDHASRVGMPADEITEIADTVIVRPDPEPAAA